MQLKLLKPRQFINPLLSKKVLSAADFNNFSTALAFYTEKIEQQHDAKQSEPNIVTNVLKPFLDKLGYKTNAHSQSGQSGIDLTILKNGVPSVIIEAKKFGSADMVSQGNLNKKAFHEAILYFMRERQKDNDEICHVIITDFFNWYVFDAKKIDRLFWQNKNINKFFQTLINPGLLGDTTKDFYQHLEKEITKFKGDPSIVDQLECAYFDVRKIASEKDRVAVCKLLGADTLLKLFNPNDANSLSKDFYTELLYIIGLEESKKNGKKIIDRAGNPQSGSIYENVLEKLTQYGKASQFEDVIKLLIIWLNRILFLKLLESQVVSWTGNKNYKFLTSSKIGEYDKLENIFFDILANEPAKRKNHDFDYIPYLNSSLFEPHSDERDGLYISQLSDDSSIKYFSKTVLKDSNKKRKSGNVGTLSYLFDFLDAFDFSSEGGNEVATEAKSLISASVLGLIFEKINGYKDGSYYTPSFVTMHMAKESIEKALVAKFNETNSWSCSNLIDVHNKIDDIAQANKIINNLKICDPAVGSGHFLVSALNEILRIKSELGVLVDESGLRIKDFTVSTQNDELIIKSDDGELFDYKKDSVEKTRIQKTLFQEKQLIIESCLFGVDINPNSVNICRLRLWVELLKSAYYKPDGALDTLPNIDINIKCGNSLISRFDVKDDLKSNTIKNEMALYKAKVYEYKENIGSKRDVLTSINAIKGKFNTALKSKLKVIKDLNSALNKYVAIYGFEGLGNDLTLRAIKNGEKQQTVMFESAKNDTEQKKALDKLMDFYTSLRDIESGKIYENAFEWRFEFPEVLSADGSFSGFDIVIANPPYIDSEAMVGKGMDLERHYISENYSLAKGNWDIYVPFIERGMSIASANGLVAVITPDKWLTKPFGIELRKKHGGNISALIKAGRDVFDSASIDSLITLFAKNYAGELKAYVFDDAGLILKSQIKIVGGEDYPFDVLFSDSVALLNKVSDFKNKLSDLVLCESACATSDAYKIKPFIEDDLAFSQNENYLKMINTGTIGRYVSKYGKKKMTYLKDKYEYPVVDRKVFALEFKNSYGEKSLSPKLIGKGLTLMDWCLDHDGEFIPGKSTLVVTGQSLDELKLGLAILNSKLISFYVINTYSSASYNGGVSFTKDMINSIPLPNFSTTDVKSIVGLIDGIINDPDDIDLQDEIDFIIYRVFSITYDEFKTVAIKSSLDEQEYIKKLNNNPVHP